MDLWALFRRRTPAQPAAAALGAPAYRRPEWPSLPPVQRVIDAPSLVTAPDRFRDRLASWANPSLLGEPGHLVTPDAPAGLGHGLAVAAEPAPGATSVRAGHELPAPAQPWWWPLGSRSRTVQRAVEQPAPPDDPSTGQSRPELVIPVWSAVVQRAAGPPDDLDVGTALPWRAVPAASVPPPGPAGLLSAVGAALPPLAHLPSVPLQRNPVDVATGDLADGAPEIPLTAGPDAAVVPITDPTLPDTDTPPEPDLAASPGTGATPSPAPVTPVAQRTPDAGVAEPVAEPEWVRPLGGTSRPDPGTSTPMPAGTATELVTAAPLPPVAPRRRLGLGAPLQRLPEPGSAVRPPTTGPPRSATPSGEAAGAATPPVTPDGATPPPVLQRSVTARPIGEPPMVEETIPSPPFAADDGAPPPAASVTEPAGAVPLIAPPLGTAPSLPVVARAATDPVVDGTSVVIPQSANPLPAPARGSVAPIQRSGPTPGQPEPAVAQSQAPQHPVAPLVGAVPQPAVVGLPRTEPGPDEVASTDPAGPSESLQRAVGSAPGTAAAPVLAGPRPVHEVPDGGSVPSMAPPVASSVIGLVGDRRIAAVPDALVASAGGAWTPAVQRSVAGRATGGGPDLEPAATIGAGPTGAVVAAAWPSVPIARQAATASGAAPAVTAVGGLPPSVQRLATAVAAAGAASEPEPPPAASDPAASDAVGVPSDATTDPAVVSPPAAAPSPQATGATAAAGGAAAAGAAPTDVDALVRRLYDPLVRRLKAELRLDRERAGNVLDLRH